MIKLRFASTLRSSRLLNALTLCGLSLLMAGWVAPAAEACKGYPPPRSCGKALVLAQGAPPVLLLPGGGTFDVPLTVYFNMVSFPAGSGVCPAGPYAVDLDLTVTCTPSADGGGVLMGEPIVFGYNDFSVPVTLPPGPPRLCEVEGLATVSLADGMVLTAENDSVLCVGDPAPGNPMEPRLDMILIGELEDAIQNVHPGDQTAFTYRITNNDPTRSYTGQLAVESVNSSRTPGMSGPSPPGTGVFPISDPGLGDNFPISLPGDLIDGCVPLPLDPSLPVVPTLTEPIFLPPLSSMDVAIFARAWGMCADGSCSRGKLVLDGDFSDATAGIACSGFVHAADTSVPPTYLWPDGGQMAVFPLPKDPSAGLLTFTGAPLPEVPLAIDAQAAPPQLLVGGKPLGPPFFIAGPFQPELGRVEARWQDPNGLFPPNDSFNLLLHLELAPVPSSKVEIQIVSMGLMAGAPTGFDDVAPFGKGQVGIQFPGEDLGFDAFLELAHQVSGQATDDTGALRDLILDTVAFAPSPSGTGIDVALTGMVAPGPGTELELLQIYQDLTGFFSEKRPPTLFTDGFESGNTAAWSITVP